MHYTAIATTGIDARSADYAVNLVAAQGGKLYVAERDRVRVLRSDLTEISSMAVGDEIRSLDVSDRYLLVQCRSGAFAKQHDDSALVRLPPVHGGGTDHYCVDGDFCWFVSQNRELCAIDIRDACIAHRYPLDSSWFRGTFHLRPGPRGGVVLDVALDLKLALATINDRLQLSECSGQFGYVLGLHGPDLICYSTRIEVVQVAGFRLREAHDCSGPCQGMTSMGASCLVVGVHCAYDLEGQTLLPARFEAPGVHGIYYAASLQNALVATIHAGGRVVLWSRTA